MQFFKVIVSFLSLFLFVSCEKVIDIEVKDSETKYVVEGVITNEPNASMVHISRTNPFYKNNNFEMVGGAIVRVKENGSEITLTETTPGIYKSPLLNGVQGHKYELTVAVNNQLFTASSIMPAMVPLDTLYISRGPFGAFRFATVGYADPRGLNNRYRFVQYLNGKKDPEIFWETDEFNDGIESVIQLYTSVDKKDDPRNINTGDKVIIEMQGIDEPIYRYWSSLQSGGANGRGSTAAPANPLTNIRGGALGYFSAHTVNRKTVIVP